MLSKIYHHSKPIILSGLILLLSACLEDVPRDNPLDPASGDNNLEISGQVLTFYHPRKAISQASLLIQPGNLIVLSDASGLFGFSKLNPGEYTLICRAEGFKTDSVKISLNTSHEHTFLLDGLPHFENISIRAHHRSRWFPLGETYFIELKTVVDDIDGIGDIHSVVCEIPDINFTDTLQAEIESGSFSSTLFDSDLPLTSVHQLTGKKIFFKVEDDLGTITQSEAHYLTRIIEQTPVLSFPVELEAIGSFPIRFQWERVSAPYPANLRIEIFQINLGIAFKIDEIQSIGIDDQNHLYTNLLNPGDYFWTLNIVDEFGNSSSSREGTFQIK